MNKPRKPSLARIAFDAHWRGAATKPEWNAKQHAKRWGRTAAAVARAVVRRAVERCNWDVTGL